MENKQHQQGHANQTPGQQHKNEPDRKAQQQPGQRDSQVGKDTDGDGRVVQPGHRPGEVDGDKQKNKQQH